MSHAEIRQDALAPLRLYAKGVQAGIARASVWESLGTHAEARAVLAMSMLGWGPKTIRALLDQSAADLRPLFPHSDAYEIRYMAALRVSLLLRAKLLVRGMFE